jgi:hypothetical protein
MEEEDLKKEILPLEFESDSSPRWKDYNKGFLAGQLASIKEEIIFLNKLRFDYNNYPETRREIDFRIEELTKKVSEVGE